MSLFYNDRGLVEHEPQSLEHSEHTQDNVDAVRTSKREQLRETLVLPEENRVQVPVGQCIEDNKEWNIEGPPECCQAGNVYYEVNNTQAPMNWPIEYNKEPNIEELPAHFQYCSSPSESCYSYGSITSPDSGVELTMNGNGNFYTETKYYGYQPLMITNPPPVVSHTYIDPRILSFSTTTMTYRTSPAIYLDQPLFFTPFFPPS
ncbi:hypothetical protein DFQ28_001509 [Apophysomyces sp. BC1034]|nr:hypothetical protein DFQ29_000970 [Apophysomyces sp. BC1021]KAG0190812.1 hypothetical protein DFQ28_001509 [Apophysomyces sp. BC1034]